MEDKRRTIREGKVVFNEEHLDEGEKEWRKGLYPIVIRKTQKDLSQRSETGRITNRKIDKKIKLHWKQTTRRKENSFNHLL